MKFQPPYLKLVRSIALAFAFVLVGILTFAQDVDAQTPAGTWVLRGPSGPSADVTVAYWLSGSQNTTVNVTVSRGTAPNVQKRFYTGLKNNPVSVLYKNADANHGGQFVVSINSVGPEGPMVSVPNFSFFTESATPATYQTAALQSAIEALKADEPVLARLQRDRVFEIGYIAGAFGHATGDFSRSYAQSLAWTIEEGPVWNPPSANNFGACVSWCEWFSWDCTVGERACIAECEVEYQQYAVEWRQKCSVIRPWVIGQTVY